MSAYVIERVANGYIVRPDTDEYEPDRVHVFSDEPGPPDPFRALAWLRERLAKAP